jgi:hypothetical protein
MARKNNNNGKLQDRNKTLSTESTDIEGDNSQSPKEVKRQRASGIGDVIAKATEAIGIVPCIDCEKRKDWLNVNFPFNKPKPLTDEQKESVKNEIDLIEIYNDVFNTNIEIASENVLNAIKNKLIKLSEF